jgi:hypothetical protein
VSEGGQFLLSLDRRPDARESAPAVIVDNAGRGTSLIDAAIDSREPEDAFFHATFARRGTRPLVRNGTLVKVAEGT